MLTIFTIPKPFLGHIGIIQRNAIQSWKLLDPSIEVILFGDEEGTADTAKELGLGHVSEIICNEYGTPYVSEIFLSIQRIARYDIICFVNCDMLLLTDILNAIRRVKGRRQHFFMAGGRINVNFTLDIASGMHSEDEIRDYVEKNGKKGAGTGMDYLVFTKGSIKQMPKFLIGRPVWDNWMMWYAAESAFPFIQCTNQVMAIHQNHDYVHVPKREGDTWEGPEAQYNRSLLDSRFQMCFLRDAKYILTKRFLLPSVNGYYRRYIRLFRRTLSLKKMRAKIDISW